MLKLYQHFPLPVCRVRGLGFLFGKIGGSKSIPLGIGLRDIRSLNQYKSFVHREAKRIVINNESQKKVFRNVEDHRIKELKYVFN